MREVMVVLRADDSVREGCSDAKKWLRLDLQVSVALPANPWQVPLIGPIELDDSQSRMLPQALERVKRCGTRIEAVLGPVTRSEDEIYFPLRLQDVHLLANAVGLAMGLAKGAISQPTHVPLVVAERRHVPEEYWEYVIHAFATARRRLATEPVPFSLAVFSKSIDGWKEDYIL